jgi:hypothetical protein
VADAGGCEREPADPKLRARLEVCEVSDFREAQSLAAPECGRPSMSWLSYTRSAEHGRMLIGPAPKPHLMADMPFPAHWSTIYVHRQ